MEMQLSIVSSSRLCLERKTRSRADKTLCHGVNAIFHHTTQLNKYEIKLKMTIFILQK
jgi:hypothetical protein